jgi:NodT family efflux transporter outer membrane factor (OMF) lipoprotein
VLFPHAEPTEPGRVAPVGSEEGTVPARERFARGRFERGRSARGRFERERFERERFARGRFAREHFERFARLARGPSFVTNRADTARLRWFRNWALFSLAAIVAGCTVGPDYTPPAVDVPDRYVAPATQPASAPATQPATRPAASLAQWWTVFNDPNLSSLIGKVVESNYDVRSAVARLRQSRAVRGMAASGMGPTVDAAGSYTRSFTPGVTGGRRTTNSLQAGLSAGWEIDAFGGVRRGVEAADADVRADVEDLRFVLVSLAAEAATNYADLRSYQQRIVIARENLDTQKRSAELTRKRRGAGLANALDVAFADAQVASTSSQIPLLESAARQTIHNLSVLAGRPPGDLLADLSPAGPLPAGPPAVPTGLPSELLRRRPDIRRAEAGLHAATARIGVATADLYPRFSISGALSFSAADCSNWLNWANRAMSFGPAVSWRLFDTCRNAYNIEAARALQEQALLAYRQSILLALQEVENALVASAKEQERRKALQEAVAANVKAVELATRLYSEGETDFLNVLDAQRSLFGSQDALAQSNRALAINLIALYRALGGGWQDYKVPPATQPACPAAGCLPLGAAGPATVDP